MDRVMISRLVVVGLFWYLLAPVAPQDRGQGQTPPPPTGRVEALGVVNVAPHPSANNDESGGEGLVRRGDREKTGGAGPTDVKVIGDTRRRISREEHAQFALTHRGDARRGQALFADLARLACARCHRVRAEGGDIGPDLSNIGGKYDRAQLIESVLEPSRQIVEGYRSTVVATTDGRVLTGIVRDESDQELTIVENGGSRHVLRQEEIEERKTGETSLMPEALASELSRQEVADLIDYLQGLRAAGQGTPGSGVVGPVTLPPGFVRSGVAAGITGATAMEIAPDGRVFVCEQTGALRIVKDDILLKQPFAGFKVDSTWERGLLGVALDPGFARNGFVYVCYVSSEPKPHHRISRLTARGDTAVPGSEVVLFEGDDQTRVRAPEPAGHQGGAIHFGVDGKLYVALGEQTSGKPAQDLGSLLGKILRLDADGGIPADNPFYQTATGKYRAIWVRGLRNPFTFAVQPGTGRLLINDVGQDRWEEINEGVAGANYGWPMSEGAVTDPRFRGPIHHYPVGSIAGGAFGPTGPTSELPSQYQGLYFFADFVKGWIKTLDPDHPARVETFAAGLTRPVDLKFDRDGSLYILLRDAWVKDKAFPARTGTLHRVRYRPRANLDLPG
jgi:putative heme-binding domain-containing protein